MLGNSWRLARKENGPIRGPTPSPFATFAIEWAVAAFAGEETGRSAKRGMPTALPERGRTRLGEPAGQEMGADWGMRSNEEQKGVRMDPNDAFTTETAGLPEASEPGVV